MSNLCQMYVNKWRLSVWEESGGPSRYEEELFLDGMKDEFELAPRKE